MLVFEKNEEVTLYQGVPRASFSFTYIPPLNSYALFGGANTDTQLYLFSITKGTWTCQPINGSKKPTSRKYHAAVFLQFASCLLINGGEDDQGRCLQDFCILSIRDWKWQRLLVVRYPQPRERHSIFVKPNKDLILFGGVSHYNENTNDLWLLKQNDRQSKPQSLNYESSRMELRSRVVPEGRFLAEGMYYNGDKLYAASLPEKGQQLRIFYFDFRLAEWREIQLKIRCSQVRMFKALPTEDDEGFILALSDTAGRKNTPCKFYFYDINSNRLEKLQDEAELLNNCDEACGDGSETQTLCLRQGKRLFTVRYAVAASQQPESSIEDCLIAIKHQQYLSRELTRKNGHLEQLYREMQNYITQLHKQYVRFEQDHAVEAQRARHIEDCHNLKREYSKFDRLYDSATEQVRSYRKELSAFNDDFERCMETEFDEQA